MDGTALYVGIVSVFGAQAFGIDLALQTNLDCHGGHDLGVRLATAAVQGLFGVLNGRRNWARWHERQSRSLWSWLLLFLCRPLDYGKNQRECRRGFSP